MVTADERVAMLACSVIERNPGPTNAVRALIALVVVMARALSVEQRFQSAEALRDAADTVERTTAVRIEIE